MHRCCQESFELEERTGGHPSLQDYVIWYFAIQDVENREVNTGLSRLDHLGIVHYT